MSKHGWEGWDQYAPFYDWENRRTLGRRDVPFWRRVASRANGPVLELGCGTGRVTVPLAKAGVDVIGIDRSAAMLERARDTEAWATRQAAIDLPPFEVVMGSERLLVPDTEPDAAAEALTKLGGAGATMVNVNFRHRSPEHYVEQLEAMAEIAKGI